MPGSLSTECERGNHSACPRIVVVAPREIDELGCSCDCHPIRYDTSGGGEAGLDTFAPVVGHVTFAPMFERFTDRARRVLVLAQEEAWLLDHNFIGTEHLLLGVLHEGEGVGARALSSLGISLDAARAEVRKTIEPSEVSLAGSPPFTPRAKKVLELALRQALQLGHNYIGTEHILLGLIREGEGVGVHVLVSLGVDPQRVHQRVIEMLSEYGEMAAELGVPLSSPDRPPSRGPSGSPPDCPYCRASLRQVVAAVTVPLASDEGGQATRDLLVVYCTSCERTIAIFPSP